MTFAHARSSSCLASVLHRCSSFSWNGACFPVSSCDIFRTRFMFKPSPCMNDQIGHLNESRSHQRLVDVPIGQRGGTAARSEATIDSQFQQDSRVVVCGVNLLHIDSEYFTIRTVCQWVTWSHQGSRATCLRPSTEHRTTRAAGASWRHVRSWKWPLSSLSRHDLAHCAT